jgi:hypothetical protein
LQSSLNEHPKNPLQRSRSDQLLQAEALQWRRLPADHRRGAKPPLPKPQGRQLGRLPGARPGWVPPKVDRLDAILENLQAHRASGVRLLGLAPPRWEFGFPPKDAAGLNLIEPWWKVLKALALKGRWFETGEQVCRAVEEGTTSWNGPKHRSSGAGADATWTSTPPTCWRRSRKPLLPAPARAPGRPWIASSSGAPGTRSSPPTAVSSDDARFLATALARLPGSEMLNRPATLELNGQVVVRARGAEQALITELVLNRSSSTGPPIRIHSNRQFLSRALRLGFSEIGITGVETPIVCRKEHRIYAWQSLSGPNRIEPDGLNSRGWRQFCSYL